MSEKPTLGKYEVATGNATVSNVYHFNLYGAIEECHYYADLLQVLRNSSANDTVHIHINSPGGRIGTAVQILNWMEQTDAKVVAHLEAECHSAATLIFLAADEWVVYDNALLLFHTYTCGMWGEGHKLESQLVATKQWVNTLSEKYYKNFLTPEELELMIGGKDYWLTSDDVVTRLESYQKAREELEDSLLAEQRKAAVEQAKKVIETFDTPEE